MTLPQRNESRRLGLEILPLYLYDGPVAAATLFSSLDDPDIVFAIACYYLKALSEYVELAASDHECSVAEVLQGMGNRILATDDEDVG